MRVPFFFFSLLSLTGPLVNGQTANNNNSFPAASSASPAYLGSSTIATPLHKLYTGGSIKSFNTGNSGFSSPSLYLANTTASTGRTYFINSNSAGLLRFVDSNANADRLVINSSGNVGIGVAADATYRLNVNGFFLASSGGSYFGNSAGNLVLNNWGGYINNQASSFSYLGQVNGTSTGGFSGTSTEVSLKAITNVPLSFYTNNTEKFRVAANGNVLVGTTTDAGHKLQVNGKASLTDQLIITKAVDNSGIPAYLSGYSNGSMVNYQINGAVSTYNYHYGQYNVLNFQGYGATVAAYASAATKSELYLNNVNAALSTGYYFTGSDNTVTITGNSNIGSGGVAGVRTGGHIDATATVSKYYGVIIDQVYGSGTADKYGLYQVEGAAKNYFAGKVSIGTITLPTDYKLAVGGNIIAEKVRVSLQTGWPDYVFDKRYKLPTLREIELFIQQHQHLPGVPSAAEVEKEGIDLGDNQAVLLKKIEELTLHLIELSKKVDKLTEENEVMKRQLQNK